MKKHLFALLTLSVALSFLTTANAQFELAANTKKMAAPPAANVFEATPAFKKFHKAFPASTDETWTKTKEGFFVAFVEKGIQNRAYLSKHGDCQGLMRYYGEQDLPQAVRQIVKSTYYDDTIKVVQEVTCGNATAYLVTIVGKATWKIVRVVEGEMDLREEHPRAN